MAPHYAERKYIDIYFLDYNDYDLVAMMLSGLRGTYWMVLRVLREACIGAPIIPKGYIKERKYKRRGKGNKLQSECNRIKRFNYAANSIMS